MCAQLIIRRFEPCVIVIAFLLTGVVCLGQQAPRPQSLIEVSKPMEKPGYQGTTGYSETEREKVFEAKVTESKVDHWTDINMPPPEGVTITPEQAAKKRREKEQALATAKAHTLEKQDGQYAGWFGIVRKMTWNEKNRQTELLIEHKFQDGLSDAGMLVVSIYGGGDFKAIIPEKIKTIPHLGLVRVLGKVSVKKDELPMIRAEYVREWDWGLFTFMDYGVDQSNPKWVALRQLKGHDAYKPVPSTDLYEKLLGKREEPKP